MYPNTQHSDFTVPTGAVIPLPGPRRVRVGSFSEQRGFKYDFTIQIDPAKPTGNRVVTVAKGELGPRAGALPRRIRRKQPQPVEVEVEQKKEFELFR